MSDLTRSDFDSRNLPQVYSQTGNSLMAPYPAMQIEEHAEQGIDLREIWRTIYKYRRTILLFTAIVVVTTVFATLMKQPVYRATALVEVVPNSRGIVNFQNVDQGGYEDPWVFRETQAQILKSESLAKRVADKLQLSERGDPSRTPHSQGLVASLRQLKDEWFKPLIRGALASVTGETAPSSDSQVPLSEAEVTARNLERMVGRVRGGLTVSLLPQSNLFRIGYDSTDPQQAAEIANTVANEYIRMNDDKRFQSTAGAKAFLEREIDRIQAKLETSEKDLTEFARKNQVVDLEDKNNIMASRLQELNASLTEVRNQRIAAEALYTQAKNSDIDALPAILQDDLIQTLKGQYASLQSEYFELSRKFKPKYPKVQQLKARLDEVKQGLDREVKNAVASFEVNYQQLVNREDLLEQAVQQQKAQLLNLQNRAIQYNILKREWETNKELYSGLLERIKEVGVAAGMEVTNAAVIDLAKIPGAPYKPNMQRNLALALLVGLMGGIGLAFLLSFLDNTIRSPEELERITHLPSLGLVPKVNMKTLPKNVNPDLLSHEIRDKDISEAFRSIRTSLMFSSPGGAPKTLLVTSSSQSEGKTLSAVNLAIVLAQNGNSVLLVDCDLRKPRLHKVFKMPRGPGLTEYLVTGELEPFRETPIPNLSVLTSGTPPPNPAELLSAPQMDRFLEETAESFDYVIVDSPPILGLADPIIMSTKAKGVLLVVAAGKVSKRALKESIKRLRSVRAPVLGATLNQIEPDSSEYGYYNRYYYNYGLDEKKLAQTA